MRGPDIAGQGMAPPRLHPGHCPVPVRPAGPMGPTGLLLRLVTSLLQPSQGDVGACTVQGQGTLGGFFSHGDGSAAGLAGAGTQ